MGDEVMTMSVDGDLARIVGAARASAPTPPGPGRAPRAQGAGTVPARLPARQVGAALRGGAETGWERA